MSHNIHRMTLDTVIDLLGVCHRHLYELGTTEERRRLEDLIYDIAERAETERVVTTSCSYSDTLIVEPIESQQKGSGKGAETC